MKTLVFLDMDINYMREDVMYHVAKLAEENMEYNEKINGIECACLRAILKTKLLSKTKKYNDRKHRSQLIYFLEKTCDVLSKLGRNNEYIAPYDFEYFIELDYFTEGVAKKYRNKFGYMLEDKIKLAGKYSDAYVMVDDHNEEDNKECNTEF